jgi:hypothetical protein
MNEALLKYGLRLKATLRAWGTAQIVAEAVALPPPASSPDPAAQSEAAVLEDEVGLGNTLPSFAQAKALMMRSVRAYNELRPHGSCDFLTPSQAHTQKGALVRRWKSYQQAVPTPGPS